MGDIDDLVNTFDIVIIGAGTAGSVLINRLSEDESIKILVLDAGEDLCADENVYTPGLCSNLLGDDKYDWKYVSEVEPGINNRQLVHPRGKVFGGTSAINSFALIYPAATGMDVWAELGNVGWDWKGIQPYLKKFQTICPPTSDVFEQLNLAHTDGTISSTNGPLQASFPSLVNPLDKAWSDTWRNLGLDNRAEALEGHALGGHISTCHISGDRRERSHAGNTFLAAVRSKPNIRIIPRAMVYNIELEKMADGLLRAVGVHYTTNGVHHTAFASKEVILSAGTFNTPQLLELSGIGIPEVLQNHGIAVKYANKHVGEKLQDHIKASISFEAGDGVQETLPQEEARRMYEEERTGPWTRAAHAFAYNPLIPHLSQEQREELEEVVRHSKPSDDSALEKSRHAFICASTLSSNQATATSFRSNRPASTVSSGSFISLSSMLSYPLSTGSVHIQSADPTVKPRIHFGYYSHPLDIEIHARHVQALYKIAHVEPLVSFLKPGGQSLPPGLDASTVEGAKKICRDFTTTNYHPCGTAAMLPEAKGGVVSERLIVYGTSNLRVVDASVMPIIPRGNIITLVYGIAEKAADIISQDLGLRRTS